MGKNGKLQLKLGRITCRPAIDATERYGRLLEILLQVVSSDIKNSMVEKRQEEGKEKSKNSHQSSN